MIVGHSETGNMDWLFEKVIYQCPQGSLRVIPDIKNNGIKKILSRNLDLAAEDLHITQRTIRAAMAEKKTGFAWLNGYSQDCS